MARKKIKDIKQTNGVLPKPFATLKSLDQIFGQSDCRYKTSDASEYEDYIKGLQKFDLQIEATNIGIVPIDDRNRLMDALMNKFRIFHQTLASKNVKLVSLRPEKNLLNLLSEGAN